jgi:DNA-binding PadR family transcriptional regulator
MTPAQQQMLDTAILRLLDEQRTRLGLGIEALDLQLARFGFSGAKPEEIVERLDYLERKELIEEVRKEVHRANRSWRITGRGIDHLDHEG